MSPKRIIQAIETEETGTVALRLSALLTHAMCTLVLAILVFFLIRLLWYPDFYWVLAGGSDLFLLICTIDAILGPLLTFAVFNPAKGKRRLKFDLSFIATVQLLALSYGLWTVAAARPVYLAYSVDRFNLVRASELTADDLQSAELPQYQQMPWTRPQVIGTREPRSPEERLQFIDSALAGRDRHLMPKTYVPFEQVVSSMLTRVRPLDELKSVSPANADMVSATQQQLRSQHPNLGFVPVVAQGDWIVVVDRMTGQLLTVLPLDGLK